MLTQFTPPSALIPPTAAVKSRLSEVCAEARLLRRLLQLSRDAESRRQATTADQAEGQKVTTQEPSHATSR